MNKLIDLFDGFRYKLINISYQDKETDDNDSKENSSYEYYDTYKLLSYDEEKISIDFERIVSVNVGIQFDLSISYRIEHIITKEKVADVNEIDIPIEIDNNIQFFSGGVMSYVSVLISEITTTFGRIPVVTSPEFTNRE